MTPQVDTADLRDALERAFEEPLFGLARRPSLYSSSFAIEELEVELSGGRTVNVIFKNLGYDAMLDNARAVKLTSLYDPQREICVYRSLLSALNTGTPRLYGAILEPSACRYWLFLEKVPGEEIYQLGDFEMWVEAARWLGRFHALPACQAAQARQAAPRVLEHDAAFYRFWLARACSAAGRRLQSIADGYERVIEALLRLPRTLIHGEFYASNVLVDRRGPHLRICPVDWEMASIGPGLLDVAALAAGKWTRKERLSLARAYESALPVSLRPADLTTAFDCCQLQIAVQWLAWWNRSSPPAEHVQEWLGEALWLASERSSLAEFFS